MKAEEPSRALLYAFHTTLQPDTIKGYKTKRNKNNFLSIY